VQAASTNRIARWWPSRWRVALQVALPPAVAAVCAALVGAVSWRALDNSESAIDFLVTVSLPTTMSAGDIDRDLSALQGTTFRVMTYHGAGFEAAKVAQATQ
jgi:hypothetical protein